MSTYSPFTTLRCVKNELIAALLEHHVPNNDIDMASRKETDVQSTYEAIKALPNETRIKIENDLRNVAIMADKKHLKFLQESLLFEDIEFPESTKTHITYNKAMWALLNHPDIFHHALQNSFAYTQPRHWHKFPYKAHATPKTDEATCQKLSDKIKDLLHRLDGRAEQCKVQHHQFQDYHYMIAYPSDYPETLPEWKADNTFDLSQHKLAFTIIFVFHEASASVDIYAEEQISVIRSLYTIWAKEVLGINAEAPRNNKSFNLSPFTNAEHQLIFPPESPLQSLTVYKISFVPRHNHEASYMIDVDVSDNKKALYEELRAKNLDISRIKRLGIEATIQSNASDTTKTKRFEISGTSCTLKHDDDAALIRTALKDLGIDVSA